MKAIETNYKGYKFRSRLEARWAVFFDACHVDWEYEPEGYCMENGLCYLPDFLLHGIADLGGDDLYVEVKGQMNDSDASKIKSFVREGGLTKHEKNPVLVVGNVPRGEGISDIIQDIFQRGYDDRNTLWPNEFNFETITGDYLAVYPGVDSSGTFRLFKDTERSVRLMDRKATEKVYAAARQARFEHGETPKV